MKSDAKKTKLTMWHNRSIWNAMALRISQDGLLETIRFALWCYTIYLRSFVNLWQQMLIGQYCRSEEKRLLVTDIVQWCTGKLWDYRSSWPRVCDLQCKYSKSNPRMLGVSFLPQWTAGTGMITGHLDRLHTCIICIKFTDPLVGILLTVEKLICFWE